MSAYGKSFLLGTRSLVPSLIKTLDHGYTKKMMLKDCLSGVTVAVVALPLGLAFAIASGLTPEKGLYAAIIGGFLMAVFSGSNFQVCGPTGALVVIIFSIISRYGYEGLVVATILAGIILIFFGVMQLGFLIKYIPYPVTVGFTMGIALLIFSSQVKDFLGLPMANTPPEFFDKWQLYLSNVLYFSPSTIFISFLTLISIILVRRYIPHIPAPVVGVLVATIVVYLLDINVETIGSRFTTIKPGFPEFFLPKDITIEHLRLLLPEAFTMALLIAIESLLSCVVADSMTGQRHNSNMELVAQGIGNISAVLFNGLAVTGTIGRTMTNIRAGACSPISSVFHTLILLACMLWAVPFIKAIPLSALAGVLVVVAYDMSDFPTVRHMFRGPISDWAIMLFTFILTTVLDLTIAVYMGVMLSSLFFMKRMGELTDLDMVNTDNFEGALSGGVLLEKDKYPKGIQVFSVNGPLFFGVAARLQNSLEAMEKIPKVFILYLHNMSTIDMTGIHTLETFLNKRTSGYKVLFADIQPKVKTILDQVGIIHAVGKEHIFPTLQDALDFATKIVESDK